METGTECRLLINILDDDDETVLVSAGTTFEYDDDSMEQNLNGVSYYLDDDEFEEV